VEKAMSIIGLLSSFALRQVAGDVEGGNFSQMLGDRFSDGSQRLLSAVRRANENAWKALEISLAGESLWRCLDRPEDRAFRAQIRTFLDNIPLPILTERGEFRRDCLRELHDARRSGLLLGPIVAEELMDSAGKFARFVDTSAIREAEDKALSGMATELERAGHKSLAWLLRQPAQPGESLIVVAVRFFFRREVEKDELLARRLSFTQAEEMTHAQQEGFARLDSALHDHGERLGQALDGLVAVVAELRDAVREMGQQVAEVLQHVRGPSSSSPLPVELMRTVGGEGQAVLALDSVDSVLLPLFRGYLPQDDLHVVPDIPPRQLAGACRSCQVPADDTILVLLEATVTRSGRCSLLLGRAALYYFNDHGTRVPGCGQIAYASLVGRRIWRESWSEVGLDRGEFFHRSGSQLSADRIVEMLLAVQKSLRAS
jgi:hypothetical protein